MNLARLTLLVILLFSMTNAFSQDYKSFIVIDEIAEDLDQLKSKFANQDNVYFIEGFYPNAMEQFSSASENLQIEELHIYAPTKPGAIIFNSIAVTSGSLIELTPALKKWSKVVSNKVIIHSEVVFSGDDGILLEQQLEQITGLIFSTPN